ncbi:MAG: PHP domain-containing protein [Actinomycetota bacterium]
MPPSTVDLHSHSTASDGRLAPAELVALAATEGVEVLGLTDHDTLAGVPEAQAAGRGLGVRVIAGIEISGRWPDGQCHLLAWLPDPVPEAFLAWTRERSADREERARQMVARLQEAGIAIDWEDVAREAHGNIGRPHVADALIARGAATDRGDAFTRLVGQGCPAYIPSGKLEPEEAIGIAVRHGALVSLAHPSSLGLDGDDLDRAIARFAAAGLGAIEAHRGDQGPAQQAAYAALARRHGLLVTPGSDFHHAGRAERTLGDDGEPGIAPADLERLLSRLPGAP